MAALTGRVATSKADLLRINNNNAGTGVSGSLVSIYDGAGNITGYKISSSGGQIGNIQLSGHTITTSDVAAITITPAVTFSGNVTFSASISGITLPNPVTIGAYTATLGGTVSLGGTLTTANNVTIAGNFAVTNTYTAITNATFPTGSFTVCKDIGSANIVTVGTIASGIWNGTALTVPYGGTGLTSTTAYAVLLGGTTSTGAFQSIASVGTSGQVLTSNGAGVKPTFQAASGVLVQRKRVAISGNSGTSTIPNDATVPQNTEGSQISTLAITPVSATNILRITFSSSYGNTGGNCNILALFQDATVSAIAGTNLLVGTTAGFLDCSGTWSFEMVAGTTSSTTFNFRLGAITSGTWTVASVGATTTLGGIRTGIMTIEEFTP